MMAGTAEADLAARFEAVLRRAFPGFRGAFHAGLAAADVAGWDSVAHVNLLMDLEDAFDVEIPPEAAAAGLGRWVFSDTVVTPVVRNRHGDSSGVRGAAWLWPA